MGVQYFSLSLGCGLRLAIHRVAQWVVDFYCFAGFIFGKHDWVVQCVDHLWIVRDKIFRERTTYVTSRYSEHATPQFQSHLEASSVVIIQHIVRHHTLSFRFLHWKYSKCSFDHSSSSPTTHPAVLDSEALHETLISFTAILACTRRMRSRLSAVTNQSLCSLVHHNRTKLCCMLVHFSLKSGPLFHLCLRCFRTRHNTPLACAWKGNGC